MTELVEQLEADIALAQFTQHAVAYAFGISESQIKKRPPRNDRAVFVQQASMYLAHVAFEMSLSRVAQAFGRDRSTAASACHRIEDRRDDMAFDEYMDALEASLKATPCCVREAA
ncbi:helix-turn-helix domain-containing protein [Maricaulis sp. CAU 1757]